MFLLPSWDIDLDASPLPLDDSCVDNRKEREGKVTLNILNMNLVISGPQRSHLSPLVTPTGGGSISYLSLGHFSVTVS